MAYGQGELITASDYNLFVNQINEVYGTSSGPSETYNYGQPALATSKSVGDIISAADWTALFSTIDKCATHQGTTLPNEIPDSVTKGDIITAFGQLPSAITSIINNRLSVDASQLSLTANVLTKSRSQSWSTGLTQTISVNFGNYNNARYFFNTGGDIRFSSTRTGGSSTVINNTWSTLLSSIGKVKFNWEKAVSLNNYKNTLSVGFYNLTGSPKTVYSASPSGSYSSDIFTIEAWITNGILSLRAKWTTNDDDTINGTISSFVDEAKSSGEIVYPGSVPTYTSTAITGN